MDERGGRVVDSPLGQGGVLVSVAKKTVAVYLSLCCICGGVDILDLDMQKPVQEPSVHPKIYLVYL